MKKREFISKAVDILNTKNWSGTAKSYIINAFKFIYDNYNPPQYYKRSLRDYLERYLNILKNTREFKVLSVEDFNLDTDEGAYFREQIRESKNGDGNVELVNGSFVSAINGRYNCTLSGYADKEKKGVYLFLEDDRTFRHLNVSHELTHLEDEFYSFPISSALPFHNEFRKMCTEGKAVFHEGLLNQSFSDAIWCNEVADDKEAMEICSHENTYPLYDILYKLLMLIFGVDVIEGMALNDDASVDMLEELSRLYPDLPVYEVYAHMVYILAKFDKNSKPVLKNIINIFKKNQYRLFSQEQAKYFGFLRVLGELQKEIMTASNKKEYFYLKYIFMILLKETQCSLEEVNKLRNDTFADTLMDICVNNASLLRSFDFLLSLANRVIHNSDTVDESLVQELDNIRMAIIDAREESIGR